MSEKSAHPHEGHRKRLKEQFLTYGSFDGMSDFNVLEMLLFFAIPRKDTNVLAHNLIDHFGSLDRVFEASFDELVKVDGISTNAATLIQMILPLYKRYAVSANASKRTFNTTEELAQYVSKFFVGETKEKVYLLCFDSRARLNNCTLISEGDKDNVPIDRRKIVEVAIEQKSSMVVLAHNHPNGLCVPSANDFNGTMDVANVLQKLNVNLLDHIIISGEEYFAMSESENMRYIFK